LRGDAFHVNIARLRLAHTRIFRHRNYRLFFVGQLVSLSGTWMQTLAQSWLVYRLTGSSLQLGLINFCGSIPLLLAAPLGGAVTDRAGPRRVLAFSQSIAIALALTLAALTVGGVVRLLHLYVLAALLGIVTAFDHPARGALLVLTVGREDLPSALTVNSVTETGARLLGFAVGTMVVAAVGEGWCFFANGISFVATLITLAAMRGISHRPRPRRNSFVDEVTGGIRFAAAHAPIRTTMLLVALTCGVGMPFTVLMPAFAREVVHGGVRSLGLLMVVLQGGMLMGAVALATRRSPVNMGRIVSATAVFGGGLLLFSFTKSFALSAFVLVPVGAGLIVELVSSYLLLAAATPESMRGRVLSLYTMASLGLPPVGSVAAGALANSIGPGGTMFWCGLGCFVGAVAVVMWVKPLDARVRELMGAAARPPDSP
jgi:MFS family permease